MTIGEPMRMSKYVSIGSVSALLSLCFLLSNSAAHEPPMPAEAREARIVGGGVAASDAWPWQVVLFHRGADGQMRAICGGSLVAKDWVLTAAHCVSRDPQGVYKIAYGSNKISTDKFADVTQVVLHDSYNQELMENDIALLKLSAPADIPDKSLVKLPIAQGIEPPQTGALVTVTGFGTTAQCGGTSQNVECNMQDELHQVDVPIVATATCRSDYPNEPETIGEHQLCAGLDQGGRDSCQGDSGGPLVFKRSAEWIQIGVVSWGAGCAQVSKPGIYTRLSAYADWITNKIGNVSATNPVTVVAGPSTAGMAVSSHLVTIAVDGNPLKIGSLATFQITSRVEGYLLVFDVAPGGKTTQLFPNQFSGSAGTAQTIRAGQTITFPGVADNFDVKVPAPGGKGLAVAVVTKYPQGLSELNRSFGDMREISLYPDLYARLEVVLRARVPINPLSGKGDWAMGEAVYGVIN